MNFSILKADLEKDKVDILNFWKKFFPTWPQRKYFWFYENIPYGPAACWIVKETEKDMVVGSTAVFPRRFLIKGKYMLGGITGDFAMDKNYRILGPELKLQKATLSANNGKKFDFLYGYPNNLSEPVQRRAGFRIVGSTYRMVKILRSNNYVRRYVSLPIVSKLFSKLVDLILKFKSKESCYKSPGEFSFEVLADFDKRFDDLWEKASTNYTIIGERTSEFLNWRFTRCPYKKFSIFALTKKGTSEVLGYIVYHVKQNSVQIADLFVMDMNSYVDALLSEFLLFQRQKGRDTVSFIYLGNEDLVNKLQEYNFSIRDTDRKIIAFIDHVSPFSSCLIEKKNWYLTEGDND